MKGLVTLARKRLGVQLWPGQVEVLEASISSGRRKWLWCLGRRSGKGIMAAVVAVHNAVVPDYSMYLRPGERRYIVAVATRLEQAREFIRTVRELLAAAPDADLRNLVDTDASTADEVVFRTGVVIRSMPCTSRSTRGLAISLVILDEAAWMQTSDEGFAAGRQVWRALLPSPAQFGGQGYAVVTSTPYWQMGIFWDLYQQGASGAASDIFVIQRPTWQVNRTITRESLESEFLADPEYARREYGAEWIEGAGAFLDSVAVNDCVVKSRKALPFVLGNRYLAAADPAFAGGGDAFTFAVGHRAKSGEETRFVIDRVEAWRGRKSPLNSDTVLDDIAALAKEYRITSVVSDQYAVVPLSDGLRRRGVVLTSQPLTNELKADIYGSLKRAVNLHEVELLDDRQLVAELIGLEIRPTPSGKPKIEAGHGGKDDRAMVVATVVHGLQQAAATTSPEIIEKFINLNKSLRTRSDYGRIGLADRRWW